MAEKQLFNKGRPPKSKGQGIFLPALGDGESMEVVPIVDIDDMISAQMHEYWEVNPFKSFVCLDDPKCPGCVVGNEPKYKAFIPVMTRDGELKIFSTGISVVRDLEEIYEAIGTIRGQVIRVSRKGTGFGTRYKCVNIGKTVNVSAKHLNVIEHLGSTEYDDIVEAMVEAGIADADSFDSGKGTPGKKVAVKKPAKKAKVSEPEESGEDDGNEEENDDGGSTEDKWAF